MDGRGLCSGNVRYRLVGDVYQSEPDAGLYRWGLVRMWDWLQWKGQVLLLRYRLKRLVALRVWVALRLR